MTRATVKIGIVCRSIQLLILLNGIGCDGQSGSVFSAREGQPPERSKLDYQVVSTVDGVEITLSDVERIARTTALPPSEALAKLQAEELLAAEAKELGFGDDPTVKHAAKQAAIQAFLAAELEPVEVTRADIEKAYRESLDSYQVPERRRSLHVLAKVDKKADESAIKAGEAFARKAIRAFRSSADIEETFEGLKREKSDFFQIVAERLDPVARKGGLVKDFEDALFGVSKPGVISEPVRTIYGWHAIVLLEILPPKNRSIEDVADSLRERIATNKRKAALEKLVNRLRRHNKVFQNESVIKQLLTTEDLGLERE
ncbi:MAG: peptidyl-prolyl cis-trans isomerase [Deltaproteobacteria bacterium]|nr:peptidyl-prolyl cis-trans isomerase [Deltaproteobacteria bacterium]